MSEQDLRMERVKKFLDLVQSGDDGLRQALVELDSANWALEARAKAAEAKVARVEALHVRSYPTASDEAYGTNVECSCGDRWPCDTRAALDGDADPADIQPDDADVAHRAAMHD